MIQYTTRKLKGRLQIALTHLALMIVLSVTYATAKPLVALDCYHNNESTAHYIWSLTNNGNFSQFASVILALGGDTTSIKTAMDSSSLTKVNVLIVVDPDTTTENPNPQYISAAEIAAIDKWVQKGGILMLLANDKGNCEFTHLNELSAQFGIHFNGDTYGGGYDLSPLPNHPFFTNCTSIHIKDISTIAMTPPAQSVLTLGGKDLMAISTKGMGTIFALGDPWLYNEYINTKDNKACGTNVMKWLFAKIPTTSVEQEKYHTQLKGKIHAEVNGLQKEYTVSGRLLPLRFYKNGKDVVTVTRKENVRNGVWGIKKL